MRLLTLATLDAGEIGVLWSQRTGYRSCHAAPLGQWPADNPRA